MDKHFAPEFKVKGKYALPLKSMTSEGFGATGPDKHEWRYRLNSFMHNFYAVGDFTGDGIQDFVVTAFRAEEVVGSGVAKHVVVAEDRVSTNVHSKCSQAMIVQAGLTITIVLAVKTSRIVSLKTRKWQGLLIVN